MAEPLVHHVVTVVADQEGTALKGEVVTYVGTEEMHREALDVRGGPWTLQRAGLELLELGNEALDVLSASRPDATPPSPAAKRQPQQRQPKRRQNQAPAKQQQEQDDAGAQLNVALTSTRPRSRRRIVSKREPT